MRGVIYLYKVEAEEDDGEGSDTEEQNVAAVLNAQSANGSDLRQPLTDKHIVNEQLFFAHQVLYLAHSNC